MAMSADEFSANLAVQNLKAEVDEAESHIDAVTLGTLSGKRLQELVDALDKSIRKRKSLKSMGSDLGHLHRITVEEGFLAALRGEAAARSAAESARRSAAQAASLKDFKLPASSTWGQKK